MKLITKYSALLIFSYLISFSLSAQQNLSLEDALKLTLESNADLKISELDVKSAQEEKTIARSMFLPSINAGGAAYHYFKLPAFFGLGSSNSENGKIPYGRFGGNDQLAFAITAVQPLYSPVAAPTLHRAQLLEQRNSTIRKAKQVETLAKVKETYLSILVLEEQIRLKQESINRNKRVLQDSRSLFLQGKAIRVDTLRAFTAVKNLEPDLVKLTFAAETKRLELKTLIGIESPEELKLTDSLTIPVPEDLPSEDEVYGEVVRNNPHFQSLNIQTQLEKEQVHIASAHRLPTLSLVGQYQVQTQTNDLAYARAYYPTSSYVGVQLAVPLFEGFRNGARIKQSRIAKTQADLQVSNEEKKLKALVHQAIAKNKEALLRLQNTAVVQETAQVSYSIIQYRYKNGISSRLELTDAELGLSEAQSNYLEALYDYLSARIALRTLMGIGETE